MSEPNEQPDGSVFDEIRRAQTAQNEANRRRSIDETFGRRNTDPFDEARRRQDRAKAPDASIEERFGVGE